MIHDSSVEIRLVRSDEHAQLRDVRLNTLAYSPHLAEHLARESAEPGEFWRGRAKRGSAAINTATFVVVDGETFAGIVDGFLSDAGTVVEIGGIWVRRDLRRSGVGAKLLGAVCGWAHKRGARRVGLWVRLINTPALRLFESGGFVPTDSTDAAVRLERVLP